VERVVCRTLSDLPPEPPDGHRAAERRGLALHAVVAARLSRDVVRRAQRTLRALERDGGIDPVYAEQWKALLSSPLPRIRRVLMQDTQEARDLRQNTPFAGALSDRDRREVLRLVNRR
jgi:hypothetical protein